MGVWPLNQPIIGHRLNQEGVSLFIRGFCWRRIIVEESLLASVSVAEEINHLDLKGNLGHFTVSTTVHSFQLSDSLPYISSWSNSSKNFKNLFLWESQMTKVNRTKYHHNAASGLKEATNTISLPSTILDSLHSVTTSACVSGLLVGMPYAFIPEESGPLVTRPLSTIVKQ